MNHLFNENQTVILECLKVINEEYNATMFANVNTKITRKI